MKNFEDLYAEEDPLTGDQLEWEWDGDNGVFVALDSSGKKYTLRPTAGDLETDDSEVVDMDEDDTMDLAEM